MADWTRIQGNDAQSTAVGTVSFGAPVASGNIVVGGIVVNTGIYVTSVTDDKSNIYDIVAAGDDEAVNSVAGFKSRGLITNGPTTITVNISGVPSTFFFKAVEEWAPPTGTTNISLDGTTWFVMPSTGIQGLAGTATSPFQTIQNDVLLFGYVVDQGTITAGTGWNTGIIDGPLITYTFNKIQATPSNSNQLTFGSQTQTAAGVCFGIAPVKASSWVPVQRAFVPLQTAVSVVLTFPQPVTPGNLIVGGYGALGGVASLVDNLGSHYESNLLSSVASHAIWWSNGLMASAPQTFTITQSASNQVAATIVEFAPPPGMTAVAVDGGGAVQNNYSGVAVTTLSTPNIVTTKSNDLIYAWITSEATVQDNPLQGFNMLNHWGIKNADSYFIQSSPGTIAPSWNFASTTAAILFGVAINSSISGTLPSMATAQYPIWVESYW
jgi:hypothetical protein